MHGIVWVNFLKGIIYLVRAQSFPKNQHYLRPDTHTYALAPEDKKCSENLTYVLKD